MKNISPKVHSLGHAILAFIYIVGVALFMSHGEQIFGEFANFWGPVFMILLFVVSATIVGGLVLGKPIMLYIDGHKKEALKFLFYTVGWIVLIAIIVFVLHPWKML